MSKFEPEQPIELISFNLCPFVQRSVITLLKKDVNFKITYIDLENKPDWFLKISPLGKVPVLKYGEEVLFESAVINEFLDEITPGSLLPTQPIEKAKERAWIEYASASLVDQYLMTVATESESFEKHSANLKSKLERLNSLLQSDYFAGDSFGLIDSAITPLITRLKILRDKLNFDFLKEFNNLTNYSDKIHSLDFVNKSVLEEFPELYVEYLSNKGSYMSTK